MREITVFTHRRPDGHRRGARSCSPQRAAAGRRDAAPGRGGDAQARPQRRAGRRARRAGQGRRRAVRRARRRRHDPARAAALRRHRGAGVRDQLRRDRLPRDGRAAGHRGRHPPRAERRLRAAAAAGDRARRPDGGRTWPPDGDQRRRDPPQGGRAGGRARVRARRRGGRQRALRRARRGDAGGLDRLQPRQRRPGDGVGGGGLRRVVHRAALA